MVAIDRRLRKLTQLGVAMLTLAHLSLATTQQIFNYKKNGIELPPLPSYPPDQWGIKAHNQPWFEATGNFSEGNRVIDAGGAYSLLPKGLGDKYGIDSWVGDDFGASQNEAIWSRWGSPDSLVEKYPSAKYVFQPFGKVDFANSNTRPVAAYNIPRCLVF